MAHGLDDALLDRRDVLPGDGAADHLVDEAEALASLERRYAIVGHAELAVAAGLLLVLALGLGLLGDGLPVRGPARPRCRPRRRTCGAGARTPRPDASRPCPDRRVWCVSSTRSTTRDGSSSCSRFSPVMSLSSSPFDRGLMATDSTAGSGSGAGTSTGVPLGASVSPVAVSASLGTATMSPAWASADGLGLLAPQQLQDVEPLVGVGAGVGEHRVGSDRPRE